MTDINKKKYIHFKEIKSTNDEIANLLKKNELNQWFYVSADFQLHGKGQRNKRWISEKKSNILLSVLIYPNIHIKNQFLLTQIVSLSLADLLSNYTSKKICIKWPNDILIEEKKIAGILIENRVSSNKITKSIVGIGININQTVFPSNIDATSLSLINKVNYNLKDLTNQFIKLLKRRYFRHLIEENSPKKEYLSKLYKLNEKYNFSLKNLKITGKIEEVNDEGMIVVNVDGKGKILFRFGEIKF